MKTFFTFRYAASLLLGVFMVAKVQAQCSCPANLSPPTVPIITLDVAAPGNGTATVTATGNNQVLCLRSSVGGATFNGIINFAGFSGITLCIGPNVTFGYGATLSNFGADGHRITNNGTLLRLSFPAGGTAVTFNGTFSLTNNGTANFGDPLFSSLYDVNFNVGATIINNASGSINVFGDLFNRTNVTNDGSIQVQRGSLLGGDFTQISGSITSSGSFTVSNSAFVSGGNIVLNSSALRVNGNYTQTGGNVSAINNPLAPGGGCGTVTVDGISSISGGVFGAGTGQVGLCDPSTRNVNGNQTGFDNLGVPPGQLVPPGNGGGGNGRLKCDCFEALPVDLLYFRAAYTNGQVKLTWATASETTNDFFTIEKSRDGKNFAEVTRLKGAGNSANLLTYAATDANPYAGLSYYRLKQTDLDGKFAYFPIKAVNSDKQAVAASLFPNPVSLNGQLQLGLGGQDGDVSVTVYDQIGRQCFQTKYASGAVPDIAVSNFTRSSGLYVVQISQGNTITRQRIVVR